MSLSSMEATHLTYQVCQDNAEERIIQLRNSITQLILITDNILVAPT